MSSAATKKAEGPATTTRLPRKLPPVPESLRKKRTAKDARRKKVNARLPKLLKKKSIQRQDVFKRAEKYYIEYLRNIKNERRKGIEAKKHGSFYVPAEPKLAFVVRIKGINDIHPKPRKVMQLLRLRQINNGVFVKLNKAVVNMLRLAEPFIAWGYPSFSTIRKLVYKRGFVKVHKKRTRLNDNKLIENKLGKFNIVCVEDLIHEIFTVGPHFRNATNFLWPFKLNTPTGGWRKKANNYVDGGDFGNREENINKILKRMI